MRRYAIEAVNRFRKRSHPQMSVALALGSLGAYALVFLPLYRLLGPAVTALGILPVIAVGWLLGMWASILASVSLLVLTLLQYTVVGGNGGTSMIQASLLSFGVTVLSGALVGRLSDLSRQLKQQMSEREQADELLVRQASDLARSNAFITALSQVTTRLGGTSDPDQVMETMGDELKKLGMTCMVAMLGSEEQTLVIRYATIDRQMMAFGEKLVGQRMRGFAIARERFPIWDELIEQQHAVLVPEAYPLMAAVLPNLLQSVIERIFGLGGWALDDQVAWLPLTVENRVTGSLAVWGTDLQEGDLPALTVFAGQVAIALENARLYVETRRQLQEQVALRKAGAAISSALDSQTVLSRIAEQMCRAVGATSAYISSYEPATLIASVLAEYISAQACDREQGSDLGATYVEDGEDEWLQKMLTGQHDVSHVDEPGVLETERAHMEEYGAKTILYIPLRIGEQLIGYAELWESRRRREFTSEEISLCQDISRQAAVALENARLYEQAQAEIVERMRAEEQIKASLKEKEVLLQEIHHRVKNNLQVISSLLNLQASTIESPETLEAFRESQNRIRSMALIHEQLYKSHDLASIEFGAYVRNLAAFLFRSYGADAGRINLEIEADEVSLGINQAVPCGLILNELMSNALKHAFPAGREGEIRVALGASEDNVTLVFSDNGVGLPTNMDYRAMTSLGLQLVSTLVDQLDGEIELENKNGTGFKLAFPMPS
jgi:two-component sensor histidine kinase